MEGFFSGSGDILAITAANDAAVHIYDVNKKSLIYSIEKQFPVEDIDISESGEMVVFGGTDCFSIWKWKDSHYEEVYKEYVNKNKFAPIGGFVFFLPTTSQLLYCNDKGMYLYEIREEHNPVIYSYPVSNDGSKYLGLNNYGEFAITDIKTKQAISYLPFKPSESAHYTASVFSPNGKDFAFISDNGNKKNIYIKDVQNDILHTIPYNERVFNITCSYDGKLWSIEDKVNPESFTGTVIIYNKENKDVKQIQIDSNWDNLFGLGNTIMANDGSMIALSGTNKALYNIYVLSTETPNRIIATLEGDYSYVTAMNFSRNNKYLVTGYRDNTVKLWDIKQQKICAPPFMGCDEQPIAVDVSFDTKYILAAVPNDKNSIVHIWDVNSQKLIESIPIEDYVLSARFCDHGQKPYLIIQSTAGFQFVPFKDSNEMLKKLKHSN